MISLKKLLIGLSVFIVLVAFGFYVFFPSEKIKNKIISEAEAQLGCPVHIESISPRWLGISIHGLHIEACKKWGIRHFSLDTFSVDLKFLPLLKKRVNISALNFHKPVLSYHMAAESPEVKEAEVETAEANDKVDDSDASSYTLDIERLRISDAAISIYDSEAHQVPSLDLGGLNYDLSASYQAQIAVLKGELHIENLAINSGMGQLGKGLAVHWGHDFTHNINQDRLDIKQSDLDLGLLVAKLEGHIEQLSTSPRVDIKLTGKSDNLKNIVALIPAQILPDEMPQETGGRIDLKMAMQGLFPTDFADASAWDDFNMNLNFDLADGYFNYQNQLKGSDIGIALQVNNDQVDLSKFDLKLGRSFVKLKAQVSDVFRTARTKGNLNTGIWLADFKAIDPSFDTLGGEISSQLRFDHSEKVLNFDGSATLKKLNWKSTDETMPALSDLSGLLQFSDTRFNVEKLILNWGQSDFTIDGQIDQWPHYMGWSEDKNGVTQVALSTNSKKVYLKDLLFFYNEDADDAEEETDYTFLDGIVVDAKSRVESLITDTLSWKDMRAHLYLKDRKMSLKDFSGKVMGGEVAMTGSLDLMEPKPKFASTLKINRIDLSQTLGSFPFLNTYGNLQNALSGKFTSDFSMSATLGEDGYPILSSLFSKGKLQVLDGKLEGHVLQNKLSERLDFGALKKIDLQKWTQAFEIEKGALNLKNLNIESAMANLNLSGTQSLDGKLNLAMDVLVPKKLMDQIKLPAALSGLWSKSSADVITLPFSVKGNIMSPDLALNEQGVKDQLTGQIKSKVEDKLKQEFSERTQQEKGDIQEKIKREVPKKEEIKKDLKKSIKKLF